MFRKTLPLAFAVLFLAAPLRAEDDPKAVVAKAIKAHGGEETLEKYKANQTSNKGKLTIPELGEVEFTQDVSTMLPGKIRDSLTLKINGMDIVVNSWVDGDKITIEAAGNAVPVTDTIKLSLKEAQYMLRTARLATLLTDKAYKLDSFGDAKVEEKPAVGVRVSSKDQKDIVLFFNKQSGLLAKIEHRGTDSQTGVEFTEERIIKEYGNPQNGMPTPKKVLINRDGKKYAEVEVVEMKYLEKLDDADFRK